MTVTDLYTEMAADSPACWWKTDEASGALADSSGNSRPSDAPVGLAYQAAGPVGSMYGVTSDAISDKCFRTTATGVTAFTNISLECWAKPAAGMGANPIVATVGALLQVGNGFAIYTSGGKWGVRSWPSGTVTVLQDSAYVVGTWYHIVLTRDATTFRMYINGVLQSLTSTQTYSTAATLGLGLFRDNSLGNNAQYQFLGSVSNPAFYTTALSQARCQAHYDAAMRLPLSGGVASGNMLTGVVL